MEDTEPPTNPLSVPQDSCKYCDTIRFGSIAEAETAKHTAASPAAVHLNNQRLPKLPLRKIFEFLNHDLAGFLQRIFVASDDIKDQMDFCLTRCWYA